MNAKKLNLGCGDRYRPGWVNVNFTSRKQDVIAADLNEGIPFPNESFDIVYHSHLLEHFSKSAAVDFIKECYRVLKPGGIIRVVSPDLEAIARTYLIALEHARAGVEGWEHNYDWMMLEMYDQTVRNCSGGEMARYLAGGSLPNEEFVVGRCGVEMRNIITAARREQATMPVSGRPAEPSTRRVSDVVSVTQSVRMIFQLLRKPSAWKEVLLRRLLGSEYEALSIGRFRVSGEIHQWMYDSYSLGRLLTGCGFKAVAVMSATESYIPEWDKNNLDTEADGSVYKPDSLFVEAIKP